MVLLASEFDKSRFLNSTNLTSERKFKIKAVTAEEIGEKKERKPVLWFTNDELGWPLNATNRHTLSAAFGDNMEAWVGKIIVIFPTMTDLRGKMVPALRVRIPPPKQVAVGNGQGQAMPTPVAARQPPKPTVAQTLDEFADENEPPAKPAAKPSPTDDMDDEIPW
ncbi:MAG: hypothetical protein AUI16_29770 [Alphaproteobacteria bacterium 13_2_20CM_2_64_7]|jgi:hypothetical protein|nr:MAG: hypothetical protein AUI16_29770 [Alphaproteobacteria bacterium 13_2_20CM_2_64_7]